MGNTDNVGESHTVNEGLRNLAISSYNRAYRLICEESQTDPLEGLELAATSLHLWREIGTDKNLSIGLWLFSRALHRSGAHDLAIASDVESVALARKDGTDWLIASALEGLTRASADSDSFGTLHAETVQAITAIIDNDDRALIESQFEDLR